MTDLRNKTNTAQDSRVAAEDDLATEKKQREAAEANARTLGTELTTTQADLAAEKKQRGAAEAKAGTLETVLAEVATAIDNPDLLSKVKDALGSGSPNDAD